MSPLVLLGFAKKVVAKKAAADNAPTRTSSKKYYILNFIRFLNILSLVSCGLATGSLLFKSSSLKISIFNAFDAAEKVLLLVMIVFLLATETPKVGRAYFARNWPMFSQSAGFFTLALAMLFIGVDVLSYLIKKGTDKKSLGADWYRMCLAAGIMTILVSAFNMLATFFCRDKSRALTARQVRAFKTGFPGPEPIGQWQGATAPIGVYPPRQAHVV